MDEKALLDRIDELEMQILVMEIELDEKDRTIEWYRKQRLSDNYYGQFTRLGD